MMRKFYLFIPKREQVDTTLDSAELSWVYEDVNNDLKFEKGMLNEAVKQLSNCYVTIVIPGEDVLFLTADVPGTNIQRVQQAVPYVLEDSLIDDVDELYFAINKLDADNHYNVSIINKEYFESLINELEKIGIQADAMVADYFLLNINNVLFSNDNRIISNGTEHKFSTIIDNTVVDILKENDSLKLIHCNNDTSDKLSELAELIRGEKELCDTTYEQCLISHSSSGNIVNLLQGTYKKKKNWSQASKTWMPVAALFLVWICVQGGLFVADYIGLSKQNKLLNIEITKIYKTAFPKSKRIIDPRAQMQQQLISLKKRRGQSGRSFTEMLSNSSGILSKSQGLKIKSLKYYDGRINLELQIASLQALDKLKEQLNKEKGYKVEIQNASSGKGSVTARIQIVGAES